MDELKVNELLGEYADKAKDLLSEEGKVEDVLKAAEKTLSEIPTIGDKVAKLPLMFSMIRSYVAKEYTDVSPKVVASMVGAFLYLISRKDLIPDKIPVLGLADDVGILALALKLNENELNTYAAWRDNKDNTAAVEEETSVTETETEAETEA